MALDQSAWPEPGTRRRLFTSRQTVVAAVLVAAGVLVYLELRCASTREWLVAHPFTVALGAGLALLALTVLAVERLFALVESRRWRSSALAALDAYLFSADRAVQRIVDRLLDLVRTLPAPPQGEPRVSEALEMLLEQDRPRLVALSDFVREQTDSLAVVAMGAVATLTRHEPLVPAVERIAEQQRRLAEVADRANFLSFIGGGYGGPHDAKLKEHAAEHMASVQKGLQMFTNELHEMRWFVMRARESTQKPTWWKRTLKRVAEKQDPEPPNGPSN